VLRRSTGIARTLCRLDVRGTRSMSTSVPNKRVLGVEYVRSRCKYARGLELQRTLQQKLIDARKVQSPDFAARDSLILLEHFPVYTLGRSADVNNVLFDMEDPAIELHRVERGGEVTFHGPGQVVGYPIFDLEMHKKDLHWYMRQVEQVLIQVLASYGIEGERKSKYTGVWVGNAKVAAIGLNARKWATSHGFALNVTTDLEAFTKIIPCGITEQGTSVTSLQALLGSHHEYDLTREAVQRRVVCETMDVFQFDHAVVTEHDT